MQSVSARTRRPRDPAPSRWAYRLHRIWLTPVYRRLLRLGTPAILLGAAAVWYLSDSSRIAGLNTQIAEMRQAVEQRPEFMVQMMAVEGASPELTEAIRAELPLRFPLSSFDLDLDAMRSKVVAFNAVADARVRIRPGGVLTVEVSERKPAILWRHDSGLSLLDPTGHFVAGTEERAAWPDLPLVAGAGAAGAIPEALDLFSAAAPLADRLRGLVRMGERRWDVVLDRGQRILLPEDQAVETLERVIALDKARKMLERDISVVDFRNPRRPTVRMNTNAMHELESTRDGESGDVIQ